MSTPLSHSPIALTELVIPIKHRRNDKRDSSGRKVVFIPSPEFLAKFVDWRQSRLENIWHQWMLRGLVTNMDIPSRNTLAHLYVNAKAPAIEKQIGSANVKRGLLAPCSHR